MTTDPFMRVLAVVVICCGILKGFYHIVESYPAKCSIGSRWYDVGTHIIIVEEPIVIKECRERGGWTTLESPKP